MAVQKQEQQPPVELQIKSSSPEQSNTLNFFRLFRGLQIPNLRWYIAALLMLATTINYLDRQTLSVAVTSKSLDIPDREYSLITAAFMVAYAIMQPLAGQFIDRVGIRRGFSLSVIFWSLANVGHAFARGLYSFAGLRFLLGVGEAGNYPAAIKTISEWFPARERGLATGIFNIGSGTGAVVAPPLVALIIVTLSWQAAFVFTGMLGFVWLIAWLVLYRRPEEHPWLTPEELALITSDQEPQLAEGPPARIRELLRNRELWAVMAAKFITDPVWYFYLFWLPKYLKSEHGFDIMAIGLRAWIPFVCADIGSLLGGMLSARLSRAGLSILGARKAALCLNAGLMPIAIVAAHVQNPDIVLMCVCIAAFGHQCWSASLLILPADLFPKRTVASAYGLAGMCGIIGGGLYMLFVGFMLKSLGYASMFTIVGVLHPIATAVVVLTIRSRAVPAGAQP